MLKDSNEVFKRQYENYGDKLILDSYIPADGTYIIVEATEESFEIKEVFNIKLDKKKKTIEGKNNSNYSLICNYDYYSKLLEMNKPIDSAKIIHSNNYYSFFIKKDNLTSGKLNNKVIDGYYDILKDPYKKYSSGNTKSIYEVVEKEIGTVDIELLEKIQMWIKENIFNLPIDISGKDYLKILFKYPVDDYKRENKRYLIPNIYNKNDFNINIDRNIYGLPNDNMGLNSKKPYLENKTRKTPVPYLIDNEEVFIQRKFFEYLMNFVTEGKPNIYIDNNIEGYENGKLPERKFQGIFLRLRKEKNEAGIHDFDIITRYQYNLKTPFEYKNILNLDFKNKNISSEGYGINYNVEKVQNILNEVLFSKFLINNYFTEVKDISINEGYLKNNLLLSRDIIFNWIYKGIDNGIYPILDRISLNILKGTLLNGYILKASHQFNLRWSIIQYFKGGIDMADKIYNIKNLLRLKINSEDTGSFESDDEYYFAIGQLVNYLLSKNKGKKKPHSLANPFINAKNNEIIKEKIRHFYKKYNYDIDMNGRRFKNLYAMIIGYETESKVDQDMIIAGYLNNNLIYESDKKEDK